MTKNTNTISTLGALTLTEDSVSYKGKEWGAEYYANIFLKDISMIEFGYKSHPLLLVIAALLFLAFLGNREWILLLGAIGFVVAFYYTRQHSVVISAHSKQNIKQPLKGETKAAKDFVQEVIQAKRKAIQK